MNDLTNLINAKNMPESAFSLSGIFPYFRYMRKQGSEETRLRSES